eukprot:12548006-Alexandrium_andersonii.AAC.1
MPRNATRVACVGPRSHCVLAGREKPFWAHVGTEADAHGHAAHARGDRRVQGRCPLATQGLKWGRGGAAAPPDLASGRHVV